MTNLFFYHYQFFLNFIEQLFFFLYLFFCSLSVFYRFPLSVFQTGPCEDFSQQVKSLQGGEKASVLQHEQTAY